MPIVHESLKDMFQDYPSKICLAEESLAMELMESLLRHMEERGIDFPELAKRTKIPEWSIRECLDMDNDNKLFNFMKIMPTIMVAIGAEFRIEMKEQKDLEYTP